MQISCVLILSSSWCECGVTLCAVNLAGRAFGRSLIFDVQSSLTRSFALLKAVCAAFYAILYCVCPAIKGIGVLQKMQICRASAPACHCEIRVHSEWACGWNLSWCSKVPMRASICLTPYGQLIRTKLAFSIWRNLMDAIVWSGNANSAMGVQTRAECALSSSTIDAWLINIILYLCWFPPWTIKESTICCRLPHNGVLFNSLTEM
jgi:hypothetical protein